MIAIRRAGREDSSELLRLMRALARFERYLDEFRVTEADLAARGFGAKPQFVAWLAADGAAAAGMTVCHAVPFTYDLRPTLVLKELYVDRPWRGRGIGERLFRAAAAHALREGCGRLRWDVLNGNAAAEAFYRRLGGRREDKWLAYGLDRAGIERLAQGTDS